LTPDPIDWFRASRKLSIQSVQNRIGAGSGSEHDRIKKARSLPLAALIRNPMIDGVKIELL
jgi:hypothetical protein